MIRLNYFAYNPGLNPYQRLFSNALESEGVRVSRLSPGKWFPLQRSLTGDIDLLHVDWPHDMYTGKNGITRQLKKLMYLNGLTWRPHIPVIWTAHNVFAHDHFDEAYEHDMMQRFIDRCRGIVTLSDSSQQELKNLYSIHPDTIIKTIHHGHYIEVYPNEITQEEARVSLNLSGNDKVVVFFGRISPYKGLEELIGSIREINDPNVKLVIAGPPHNKTYVDALLRMQRTSERITIIPEAVPVNRVQVFMNAADVLALPFRKITNSGSLLLAMSFGKPVVAPDAGSISEIAYDEAWFGYDPTDANGLTQALKDALSLKDLTAAGEKAKKYAEAMYGWDRAGKSYVKMCEDILRIKADKRT